MATPMDTDSKPDITDLFNDVADRSNIADAFDDDLDFSSADLSKLQRYDKALDLYDPKSPQVLKLFYSKLLPTKLLFQWLNQDLVPNRAFTHREFAFTLANDAYLRYNSFSNADEFKRELLRLNPSRFEIGPVYTGRPKDRKALQKATFKPLQRELVFDIDMTDYDDIRTCCSDKAICKRCWKFIAMAVKVLDSTLRSDFGFQHLMWVYSGRRGIHCWISDQSAMVLTDDQRRAIVNYLDIARGGGAKSDKKLNLPRPLHPSILRSFETLKPYFISVILDDQDVYSSPAGNEALLKLIPNYGGFADTLRAKWEKDGDRTSAEKFNDIFQLKKSEYERIRDVNNKKKGMPTLEAVREDIILTYTYPRIDLEVSKHLNHLLKSPFCIHPATGAICVPLDPSTIDSFDPKKAITVGQLLEEYNQMDKDLRNKYNGNIPPEEKEKLWEQTSLKPFTDRFEKFVDGIVKEVRIARKATGIKSMEF